MPVKVKKIENPDGSIDAKFKGTNRSKIDINGDGKADISRRDKVNYTTHTEKPEAPKIEDPNKPEIKTDSIQKPKELGPDSVKPSERSATSGANSQSANNNAGSTASSSKTGATGASTGASKPTDSTTANSDTAATPEATDGASAEGSIEAGATTGAGTDNLSPLISFFTDPKILIGAGIVGGIITAIAVVGNSIKARFRKTAKTLFRLQKDFGGSKNGLDMDHAFKGVGSKITDVISKLFGAGDKGKGAIGMVPFVTGYQDEIRGDFEAAKKSFGIIALAGKSSKDSKLTGEVKPNSTHESLTNIVTYNSFTEAFNARKLNESYYTKADINESVTGMVMSGIALGKLAFNAGKFVMSKVNSKGKLEPAQAVQVTPQSTREICYSIMTMFFNKYFNMEGVSKKLGFEVSSLGDIDKSNIDKFKKLIEALKDEQANNKNVSVMYKRVHTRYEEMLKHYEKIARKLVDNFGKFSLKKKGGSYKLSEKNDNLITSSTEKLYAEIERQMDIYKNNFFRVINAIVSSPEYVNYINFIINQVLPVFETGLAGDADFILDILPKKGEFYVVRQTAKLETESVEKANALHLDGTNGNVIVIKVLNIDTKTSENPTMLIQRIGLIKRKGDAAEAIVPIKDDGQIDFSAIDKNIVELDKTAFSKEVGKTEGDEKTVPYTKWLAMDPILGFNFDKFDGEASAEDETQDNQVKGYSRENNGKSEVLIYINGAKESVGAETSNVKDTYSPDISVNEDGEQPQQTQPEQGNQEVEKREGPAVLKLITKDSSTGENVVNTITLGDQLNAETVENVISSQVNVKFSAADETSIKNAQQAANDSKARQIESTAKTQEELVNILNSAGSEEENTQFSFDKNIKTLLEKSQTYAEYIVGTLKGARYSLSTNTFNVGKIPEYKNTIVYARCEQDLPVNTGVHTSSGTLIIITGNLWAKVGDKVDPSKVELVNEFDTSNTSQNGIAVDASTGAIKVYKDALQIRLNLSHTENGDQGKTDITDAKLQNGTYIWVPLSQNDAEFAQNLKTAIDKLINVYQQKQIPIKEGVEISYSSIGLNESLTSVKLNRQISGESLTNNSYIVSISAWGDGSQYNLKEFVVESLTKLVKSSNDYYDLAAIAKTNKNIRVTPLKESETYSVSTPYNRFGMLTEGNPLYEAVAIITIDNSVDKNITSRAFLGVNKIVR